MRQGKSSLTTSRFFKIQAFEFGERVAKDGQLKLVLTGAYKGVPVKAQRYEARGSGRVFVSSAASGNAEYGVTETRGNVVGGSSGFSSSRHSSAALEDTLYSPGKRLKQIKIELPLNPKQ